MKFQKGHKINVGNKNHLGFKHSAATKIKIGLKSKARKIWNIGLPWSDDVKKKISQTNKKKGIEPKEKYKKFGKDHWNWKGGRPKCIDCGEQLVGYSAKRCFRCMHKGKLAYNWKGGLESENHKIRNSIEFRLWRESVFARDNWICQKTGKKGGKLHPHHIYNFAQYPELRLAIDNGITFSKESHELFHKIYGKKNNTKEQVKEFLKIDKQLKVEEKPQE